MNSVKIPEGETSEIEKNSIRIFNSFFKILVTATETNPTFLISQRNQQFFTTFLNISNLDRRDGRQG